VPLLHRPVAALGLLWTLTGPPVDEPHRYEFAEAHLGMPVRTVLYARDEETARGAARAGFDRIAALEDLLSDYRPARELRWLEERPGEWISVSPEVFVVMGRAVELAHATDGAFDPTIGPLVSLWREARRRGRLPDAHARAAASRLVGWRHVALDPERRAVRLALRGMRLDLGGIAKGFIIGEALRALEAHGVSRAMIEAGGDIVVSGAPPGRSGWRIVTPGADAAFASRARSLTHAALSTSGADSQFVVVDAVRYSHVVDPRSGLGVTHDFVARVIAPDGATADALATALGVLGPGGLDRPVVHGPGVFATVHPASARGETVNRIGGQREAATYSRCSLALSPRASGSAGLQTCLPARGQT
jgi:thiamine biosynthesis lipoprotein